VAAYPVSMTLPYLVGDRWVEERTLAGEIVQAEHEFVVEFDRLDADLRVRALSIFKRVGNVSTTDPFFLHVIGSGLSPDHTVIRDGHRYNACHSVSAKIGVRPQLGVPASDASEVIDAYETWLARYDDLSFGALAAFIKRTAPEGDIEDGDPFEGAPDFWTQDIPVLGSSGGPKYDILIDGRDEPELFHRARAAFQTCEHARQITDKEDFELALQVLRQGPVVWPADSPVVVAAWEDHCGRLADMALARFWARQRQKAGFKLEMLRWVAEHGSDRLKLGVDDGYRMMPVYLNERIKLEVPGFYAHLPRDGEPKLWQPRTGPSEEALRLRRAVQDCIDKHEFHGSRPPKVEIGWMKDPPKVMHDSEARTAWDGHDAYDQEIPFEVIVVPDWLGRYVLFAAVWTDEEDQPPEYILVRHVLRPSDYGLSDLTSPPEGQAATETVGAAAAARRLAAATDDFIPITGTADDDIPF
jgi:hypothetical protein